MTLEPHNIRTVCQFYTMQQLLILYYSDNKFYNFTGNDGYRYAAAHCGQGSGLSPKGRMFNNSYFNAVAISNALIYTGKYHYYRYYYIIENEVDGEIEELLFGMMWIHLLLEYVVVLM